MRQSLRTKLKFTERLGFRLAFLLSVALLPLGMIALVQTWRMAQDAEQATESALYQRTSDVAGGERALIHSALGASEALTQSVIENLNNPKACSALLSDYISRSPVYSFVGFVPMDGMMTCSSAGKPVDMRASQTFSKFLDNPGPSVTASSHGLVTDQAVLIVSQPVIAGGKVIGMLSMSIAHRTLRALRSGMADARNVAVTLINEDGQILFSESRSLEDAREVLPENTAPIKLVKDGNRIFRGNDGAGNPRVFSIFASIPGMVYVVGAWRPESAQLGSDLVSPGTLLFPLTMWLTSLIVAYAAVDRLVIRHVHTLRGQMRRFALGRRDRLPEVLSNAPSEIAEVSQTFHNLARIVMRDEADREATLQEKTVLLKEIHHRVKNNLQLIASIMNMQIRQVKEPGARQVLRSVQDRVASLATIHRNLYQAESLSAVQADRLLGEIVEQMVSMSGLPDGAVRIETDFDPVTLYPDQAVPVALLATEALTNSFKYASEPEGEIGIWIRISLKGNGDHARLRVENSRNPDVELPGPREGSGLGSQLIRAFAGQLGTEPEMLETENGYRLTADFEVVAFDPPPGTF